MQPGRRFIAGATAAALVLVVAGFGVAAFDPVFSTGSPGRAGNGSPTSGPSSPLPKPTNTPGPSASPVKSSGPTPTLKTVAPSALPSSSKHPLGFVQVAETIVYFTEDGTRIPVVPIAGLQVQIQSGKAVYYALAGNKYGLKTGSYAGEFLPLVTMGQPDGSSAQTGAVVLAGPVVVRLTNDALASVKNEAGRWLVVLPLDLRGARAAAVDVSFDAFGLSGLANTPRVIVRFPGTLPLVEAVAANGGVHVHVEGLGITAWQVTDPARLSLPADKIDPAHAMNQLLIYGDGKASLAFDQLIDGRVPVGSPIMEVSGDVSVSLAVNGSHADVGPGNVLQVAGVPVFVATSS
jgi:hypothetical protein